MKDDNRCQSCSKNCAIFTAAHEDHKRGNLAAAIHGHEAALAENPGNVDALHWLGVAHAQRGDLTVARNLIERAIGSDTQHAVLWTNYGNVLKALACQVEALVAYDKALRIDPIIWNALFNRANQTFEWKCWAEALKVYEATHNVGKQGLDTVRSVAECILALERYEDALALTEKVRVAQPRYEPTLLLRAYALGGLLRFEEALATCDELLSLSPSNAIISTMTTAPSTCGNFFSLPQRSLIAYIY